MTDAEKAYQIAEQRIERAWAEGFKDLSIAPIGYESDGVEWKGEKALEHPATIPPSISILPDLTRLDLDYTQVADLTPLAGMEKMQTLRLYGTQVDLCAFVAPGAAWEREDR